MLYANGMTLPHGYDETPNEEDADDDATAMGQAVVPVYTDESPCVVVLSGNGAGKLVRVVAPGITIGRSRYAQVCIHDDGISREHARLTVDGDGDVWLEDLGSTNGTFVGEERVDGRRLLADGDRIQLGPVVLMKFGVQDEVEQQFLSHLYTSATRDALTGLHNRGAFMERLYQECATHRRSKKPMAILFVDIDHFKSVNDTHGHLAGDAVLRQFADVCRSRFRADDMIARYGGEEFVILLRTASATHAMELAEWLRKTTEEQDFSYRGIVIPITLSIGLCCRKGDGLADPIQMLDEADRCLYKAKAGGRNRAISLS
jgi:two-component system, cell cycle response regulator